MSTAAWRQRYSDAIMHTFNPPAIVLESGSGCHVTDVDGASYLDMFAGIAVNSLGHAHPDLIAAVADQLHRLGHISNLFANTHQIELAERLDAIAIATDASRPARTFLANSGTEANEAAVKITRLTGRSHIIAMDGGFHGRTMGALALTANPAYRVPFEPLAGRVTFVPFGDLDALAAALDQADADHDPVAAVVTEPIQGENGVVVPPNGFLAGVRDLTSRHGALMWLDEIQTGIGRCGHWLASHADSVPADIVTLAKGLAGGFPIGACVATGPAAELLTPGSHGTTFGGNPAAAAAALAVLDVIERDDLLRNSTERGEQIQSGVQSLDHSLIADVRGRGLLQAIVLTDDVAPAAVTAAAERGFLINAPRPSVIRIAPPLIITAEEVSSFLDELPAIVSGVAV